MISFQVFKGDSSFFDFMELQIIRETGIKSPDAAWLNEEAVKELGLSDTTDVIPINYPTTLAGVVKNFHFRDLSQKITPAYIQILKPNERPYDILIKISGAEQNKTLEEILKAYTDYFGIKPNYYGFMDEAINEWYNNQERTYTIIGYFALLAILISSLGLFAMATYFIRQQAKTIAIRKTFGSFNHEIFRQLTVTFLKLVVISYLLAIPVIWYSMTKWLSNYPYRINLSWTIFALAGLTVLIIAFIAVFRQSYKATQANPVNSLHE